MFVENSEMREHIEENLREEKPKKEVDMQQKITMFNMGLTGHRDIGKQVVLKVEGENEYIVDRDKGIEMYIDEVSCGPFSKIIAIPATDIDNCNDPAKVRFQIISRKIKIWMEELKEYRKPKGKKFLSASECIELQAMKYQKKNLK